MSASLADFAAEPPKGWEPSVETTGDNGVATVKLPRSGATEQDLLKAAGFDTEEWRINGDISYRKWMRYDQEWLHYYRFNVTRAGESPAQRAAAVDELASWLKTRPRPKPRAVAAPVDGGCFAYLASDWQIGKREGDVGTEDTVKKVADSIDRAVARVQQLRKIGRRINEGAFLASGDLGEGTCGFYPGQQFLIDANRRDQNRITRQLITYGIDSLAPLFDAFVVATVGGNHGENREEGKRVTDDADNDDVAQFEAVREAVERSGRPGNVQWVIPTDELSLLLQLGGVPVGITHGHTFTGGGKMPQAKALEWWKGQVFGLQAVADARLLISSHFHHFSVINHGARTHLQTPAMDPGSRWVSNAWGNESPSGVVTLRLDASTAMGFADLEVL